MLKEKYTTLQRTLDCMQTQIEDSLSYARNFVPRGETPRSLFALLKQHTTYRHDPPGVELLQSMPTLMHRNFYGIPGAGDCDCFTIAALACAKARGIPARAVIVGNSSQAPTHIYAQLFDGSKFVDFDLVSSSYGTTKAYKNKQIIKLH